MMFYSEEGKKMRAAMEVALQTLLAFFSILFITRILGRKQLAQLTVYEYINGITFGSIAAALATDINQRTWQHLIGLVIFGILTYIISYICMKSRKAAQVIEGEAVLVIEHGRILEKNLQKFHYTPDDLNHILRKKDVFDIRNVKYGILETTGEISIVKLAEFENLKASDMGIIVEEEALETEIIITGSIIYENLKKQNISAKWLISQLKSMGIKDIKDIFYASIDKDKRIYVDRMEDHLDPDMDLT